MSTSPTPSEREKKDKEDRAREAEEQAKLPYKWTQTISDLDITIGVPGNLRGKDIVVEMGKTRLKVGVRGQEAFIDVGCCLSFFLLFLLDECGFAASTCPISFIPLSFSLPLPLPLSNH